MVTTKQHVHVYLQAQDNCYKMAVAKTDAESKLQTLQSEQEKLVFEVNQRVEEVNRTQTALNEKEQKLNQEAKQAEQKSGSLEEYNRQLKEKLKVAESQTNAYQQEMLRVERMLQQKVVEERTKVQSGQNNGGLSASDTNIASGTDVPKQSGAKRLRAMVSKFMAMYYQREYRQQLQG